MGFANLITKQNNGQYRKRRSDTISGTFYRDSLRTQRFQTGESQIKTGGYLKLGKAILRFLTQNILKETGKLRPQRITVKSSKVV